MEQQQQQSQEAGLTAFKTYFTTFIQKHRTEVQNRLLYRPQSKFIIFWVGESVHEKDYYGFIIEEKPAIIEKTDEIRTKVYQDQTPYRIFIQPCFRDYSLFFVVDLGWYFALQIYKDKVFADIKDSLYEGIAELKEAVKKGERIEEAFTLIHWEKACKLPTNNFHNVQPFLFDVEKYSSQYSGQVRKLASDNDFYKENIQAKVERKDLPGMLAFMKGTNNVIGFVLYSTSLIGTERSLELEYQLIDKEYRGKGVGAALVAHFISTVQLEFSHNNIRIVVESKQNKDTKRFWNANNFPENNSGLGEMIINSLLKEKLDPKEFGFSADDNSERMEEQFDLKEFGFCAEDKFDKIKEKVELDECRLYADDSSSKESEKEIDSLQDI